MSQLLLLPSLLQRWWLFIVERFSPIEHLVMVLCFTLGNAGLAYALTESEWSIEKLALSFVLTLSFFFRMRCFDEVKDYATDCMVNPTRPLARGLLTIKQTLAMSFLLTGIELIIAAYLGWLVLMVYGVAVTYSYLMYKEFFVGGWLSKHLTLYAVSHTFVSILIGLSIMVVNIDDGQLGYHDLILLVQLSGVNWALFNLYEFARKTYAPREERIGVETYSSLYAPLGASLLVLSQIIAALVMLWACEVLQSQLWRSIHIVLLVAIAGVAICFVAQPQPKQAQYFRLICAAYLVVFYLLLAMQAWLGA